MKLFMYFLIVIGILVGIFALYEVLIRVIRHYGSNLNSRGKRNKQPLNKASLVLAGILMVVAVLPDTSNIIFVSMAILFGLRSLYGRLTIGRGISLFFGSFLAGVVIFQVVYELLNPWLIFVFFLISFPLLILGFTRPRRKKTEFDTQASGK